MATFRIHQDSEKENAVHANPEKSINVQGTKDVRSTFAVLNNVPQIPRGRARGQGKAVFRDVHVNRVKNTEPFGNAQQQQQKKVVSNVPVEQFKSFSVYEDTSVDTRKERQNALKQKDSIACANTSNCAIRDPLKDISSHRDGFLETPMSVGDALSPMSIDKQSHNEENKPPTVSPVPPRNDRERFFEVEEYQQNILEYFREIEKKYRPKPNYMSKQPDINYSMRTILVDWLVEVAEEYRLHNETLYLAVTYIDRFLSIMSVVRAKLQLVGTAAMFIAAKYEEIYPPDVGEFVFITDDTYTKAQVLKMEQIILRALHFDLCVPTNLVFINTYAVLYDMPDQVKFLATYIAELSLLSGDPYLHYLPSQISSAALALARYILDFPIWSTELEEITTYSLESIKDLIFHLCRTHNLSLALSQQAIQEKYKASKYMEVSTIKPVQLSEEKFNQILLAYNKSIQIPNIENVMPDQAAATNENVRKMISSLIFV